MVASQAETLRQVYGKTIVLSLNNLIFPNRNTNMAKDLDRVVPNGALEARHLGPLLIYPSSFL